MSIPINKSLDDIRTDMFARIDAVQDEYAAKGWLPARLNLNKGVVRGLIELWCWGLYQLYQFLLFVLQMAFPLLSENDWLDLHADQVVLDRKPSTKASGVVVFTRAETAGNVPVPAGRVVRTLPDGQGNVYRFVTTEAAVLPAGALEVLVPVEAEEYGRGSNVTAGQIVEIATTIPGVDGVENRADWLVSEGADAETDKALQERYRLAWQGNNGLTKYAYMAWAFEVAGVIAVTVLDQHPRGQGTLDVVIKSTAGVPTQTLIDAVTANIDGKAAINDDWLVKGPTPTNIAIAANLVLTSGDPASILAEAESRLRALFEDPSQVDGVAPLQISEDVTMDRLVAAVMAVGGVKEIVWTSPVASVVIPDDGLAVLQSLSLTSSWAVEA
jgi:uncharacterized phage protein gp47/JayE